MMTETHDLHDIDALTSAFFNLFALNDNGHVDLSAIFALCIPEAHIVKACAGSFEVYDLAGFIAPRERLLNSGEFGSFYEEALDGNIEIFQNIAQRFGKYRKWGVRAGEPFEQFGAKTMQFVKTPDGWRISALAWDDEPV